MTSYLLTYDLIKRKDYQTLWDELERLGAHRTLESVWLIAVDITAEELIEHMKKFIDADDKLWALELTKNYQFKSGQAGTNAWIAKHPPTR